MDPCDVHFNVKSWSENTTWHTVGMEDFFAGTRCELERLVDELVRGPIQRPVYCVRRPFALDEEFPKMFQCIGSQNGGALYVRGQYTLKQMPHDKRWCLHNANGVPLYFRDLPFDADPSFYPPCGRWRNTTQMDDHIEVAVVVPGS